MPRPVAELLRVFGKLDFLNSPPRMRTAAWRYGLAVAAVAITFGLGLAFEVRVGPPAPFLAFVLAVLLTGRWGGRGPALAATAFSAPGLLYFLAERGYSNAAGSAVVFAIFVAVGVLISALSGRLRDALDASDHAAALLRRQAQLVESSHDAILTTDAKRIITSWNAGAAEMYGWSADGALGRNVDELLRTRQELPAAEIDRVLALGLRWDGEVTYTTRDERPVIVECRRAPLRDAAGAPAGTLEVDRDITARRHAETQLRHRQKLESAGVLAGGVAHDFNNILTVIQGSAHLALRERDNVEHLHAILAATRRASYLTRQLLAYVGKARANPKLLDLSALVEGSRELLLASVPQRIRMDFELASELPGLEADPGQIEQILMSLVVSAGEAIPPGPAGVIAITTSRVDGTAGMLDRHAGVVTGPYVCLEVRDNGTGMDDATVARIFDPSFTTKLMPRGLGLAAVQAVVRNCNGFIEVHSSPGGGTTFQVFLPASLEKPLPPAPRAAEAELRGSATVLVVDDEEAVRRLAAISLRQCGYEVLEAENGRHALEVLAAAPALPAVVLLDLVMPIMGGDEVIPVLREKYPGLRIVVSSGYPEEDARQVFAPDCAAGFLQKPYTSTTLAEAIKAALRRTP
jgi:PAS domain S-box-containing protein